jgi:hypothetical protein
MDVDEWMLMNPPEPACCRRQRESSGFARPYTGFDQQDLCSTSALETESLGCRPLVGLRRCNRFRPHTPFPSRSRGVLGHFIWMQIEKSEISEPRTGTVEVGCGCEPSGKH